MPGGYHHRGWVDPPFGDLYDDAGKHHPNTDPLYGRVREGLDEWGVPIPPDSSGDKTTTKRDRQGRRGRRRGVGKRRARSTPKAVHVKPAPGAGNAGKAMVAYPHASQATGGAMPILELDALSEVGLTVVLAELVGHGRVTLARTLSAFQREQDRITNRTWRRPGGLARPAGL